MQCPKCGTELLVDDDDLNQVATCTGCRSKLRVPREHSFEDSDEEESGDEPEEESGEEE